MKNLNNNAFSLLEILLAAVIFVVSVAGIFATLSAVRTPVANKESALTAAIFGKQVLENLRSSVSSVSTSNFYSVCSGSCTTFDLELGVHAVPVASLPSGLTWPTTISAANSSILNYTVSCANPFSISTCGADVARRVDLNIKW